MTRTQALRFPAVILAVVLAAAAAAAPDAGAPAPAGWRGDRTGAFPAADPVTEFSESLNVLWKTPMPDWGNGSPVVAAGRVFVCAEPNLLLCVDADGGAVLWRREVDHLDLLPPEESAAVKKVWEEERAFERLRNALRYESVALKKAAEQAKRRGELEKKYGLYFDTWARWDFWIGHTMATPVCDGRHVWAAFGSNTVACYNLEGNRRWMKWLPRGFEKESKEAGDPYWGGYPHALFVASPLLVGDRLVVQSGRAIRALDAPSARWTRTPATCSGSRTSTATSNTPSAPPYTCARRGWTWSSPPSATSAAFPTAS